MAKKSKKKAKKKASKVSEKMIEVDVDAKTLCRPGSIGDQIGHAILKAAKGKEVAAAEGVMLDIHKAKKKPTDGEVVHLRAVAWIGYLKDRNHKAFGEIEVREPGSPKPKDKATKKKVKKKK